MGGCTNCNAKSGCNHRKSGMFAAIDQTLAALYPTRIWGQPDDLARFGAGVSEDEAQSLAEELAVELDAATFYRPGGPDEYCDYIYILCLGREPSLVQIRDGEVPIPEELRGDLGSASAGRRGGTSERIQEGTIIRESYLRVCLSHMARMAGVQQSTMEMHQHGRDYVIRELPRSGVYDAPLLRRFQRLVAILPAYDLLHLDFGEISAPPAGFLSGDYSRLYGGEPHTANYLFFPQPSTMQTTCMISVE